MLTPLSSQDADFESWSQLSTVTRFDEGTTQPVDENLEGHDVLVKDVKSCSSLSLLVESLIEQLCKLWEPDDERRSTLYHAICNKLHQMKVIDETYGVEELQFLRSHYQKALYRLLSVARSTAIESGSEASSSSFLHLSSSINLNTSVFDQQRLLDLSRYRTEYVELEYIAKGGFGSVHKAKNKLDGGVYAIKKICLRYSNVKCFLRNLQEVKTLALLNHPNIVSYKAAWLEPFAPPNSANVGGTVAPEELNSFLARRNSKRRQVVIGSVSEEDSYIEFRDNQSVDRECLSTIKESYEESSVFDLREIFNESTGNEFGIHSESVRKTVLVQNKESEASDDSSVSSLEDRKICEYRGFSTNPVHNIWTFENPVCMQQREWATLYVQMQLCESTLRRWLDERNAGRAGLPAVDLEQSLSAFRQVVRGVEYIHSKNVVHHDIKPSNIFISGDLSQAQVGDFGLACCLQHSDPGLVTFVLDEAGQHKGEIGTKLYAAPEQIIGKCDPKSDIYSLGIVLFELVQPFSTEMERCKVIGQLKNGQMPPQISSVSPKLVPLLNLLLSPLPTNRPTASELLSYIDNFLSELSNGRLNETEKSREQTIQQLVGIIAKKDREIEELKLRLQAFESARHVVCDED